MTRSPKQITLSAGVDDGNPYAPQPFEVVGGLDAVLTPAALNTEGYLKGVFIPAGGAVPVGLDPFTVVIELDA